ncbi:Ff.00g041860.m01.CDS01 [Fusarium sp. VM40]|nr:Ff.00g041860.m01.CDS01 [Fusarium sp. VM40]
MGADPPAPSKHGIHGLEYLVRVPDKRAAEVSGPAAALIRPTLVWFLCGTCLDAAVHGEFDSPNGQPVVVLQVVMLFRLVEEARMAAINSTSRQSIAPMPRRRALHTEARGPEGPKQRSR